MDEIPVKVVKICSPTCYLIVNQSIRDEDVSKLERELDNSLRKNFEDENLRNKSEKQLEKNDYVTVYWEEQDKFVRGLFEKKLHRGVGIQYDILLVDHGEFLKILNKTYIKQLAPMFIEKLPFRATYLHLPNLKPLTAEISMEEDICFKLTESTDWPEAARSYCLKVMNSFKGYAKAVISKINSPHSLEGQLHLNNDSLSDLLVSNSFAMDVSSVPIDSSSYQHRSPNSNATQINAVLQSNDSSSVRPKMSQQRNEEATPVVNISKSKVKSPLDKLLARKKKVTAAQTSPVLDHSISSSSADHSFAQINIDAQEINSRQSVSHGSENGRSLSSLSSGGREIPLPTKSPFINRHTNVSPRISQLSDNDKRNETPSPASREVNVKDTLSQNEAYESLLAPPPSETSSLSSHQLNSSSTQQEETETQSNAPRVVFQGDPGLNDNQDIFCFSDYSAKCWLTLESSLFQSELKDAMKRVCLETPYGIQQHSWPIIFRGRNVVMVGSVKSGKSIGYLFPALSQLMKYKTNKGFQKFGHGPCMLILCATFKTVTCLRDLLTNFLGGAGLGIRVISLNSTAITDKEKGNLLNGCDILISTPEVVLSLTGSENPLTEVNSSKIIALEDADILMEDNLKKKAVNEIIDLRTRNAKDRKAAYFMCSERWTTSMKNFICTMQQYGMMDSPHVLFSDLVEAMYFTNVEFNVRICFAITKDQTVIDIVRPLTGKIIIFASTEVIDNLKEMLETQSYSVLTLRRGMLKSKTLAAARNWELKSEKILLIDDYCYEEVKVADAKHIVHYDFPANKKLYHKRFKALMDEMKGHDGDLRKPVSPDCSCYVLITEENGPIAKYLVDFLKRIPGRLIPAKLKEIALNYELKKQDPSLSICQTLKLFGDCYQKLCKSRHVFYNTHDAPLYPENCEVDLQIVRVVSANHFYAYLLKYNSGPRQDVDPRASHRNFLVTLSSYFSRVENHTLLEPVEVGMLAAVANTDGSFSRVKILSLNSNEVDLLYIDTGKTSKETIGHLLTLPDEFQRKEPQAVEVVLANLKPTDGSLFWQNDATTFVVNLILNCECRGNIVKAMGSTIWLSSLKKIRTLHAIKLPAIEYDISSALISKKLAIKNDEHIKMLNLKCLTDNSNNDESENFEEERPEEVVEEIQSTVEEITRPKRESPTATVITEERKRNSAFGDKSWRKPANCEVKLDLDTTNLVFVPHVNDPDLIFVQREDMCDEFDELIADINDSPLKKIDESVPLRVGNHCLALNSFAERYLRAQIVNVIRSSEIVRVKIFFIDVGDYTTIPIGELRVLEDQFLYRLPPIAVPCKLAGIRPIEGNKWSAEAAPTIWKWVLNECDLTVQLPLKIIKEMNAAAYNSPKYEIILWNPAEDSTLNEELVRGGLAVPIDDVLSNLIYNASENDDPSSLSERISSCSSELRQSPDSEVEQSSSIVNTNEGKFNPVSKLSNEYSAAAKIKWYQTINEIVLKVMLSNIGTYHLQIEDNFIEFSCSISGRDYLNRLPLFSTIEPNRCTRNLSPTEVVIKLSKTTPIFWPYLLSGNQKKPWLKYDLDHVQLSDSEEENITLPIFQSRRKDFSPRLNENETDFDSSDSDISLT